MKVYSISRWAFYGICVLILVLPVSRHWKLLVAGESAKGVVGKYQTFIVEHEIGEDEAAYASSVEFVVEEETFVTHGPANYKYKEGRDVRVRYDPDDPGHNCLLTFTGLYLNDYSILPLFLLTVWGAFYLSFNNYRKKKRARHTDGLASSPYRPFSSKKATKQKGPGVSGSIPGISRKDS
jgi:hypothetical protein